MNTTAANFAAGQDIVHRPLSFDFGPLQLVEVLGDAMQPTLRGWWDYVLIAPTNRFLYDELYVIRDEHHGTLLTYRVASAGRGRLSLIRDNPVYGKTPAERADTVPVEWFERQVVGIVACILKVQSQRLIRNAWTEYRA
jgi:hypothetical protein